MRKALVLITVLFTTLAMSGCSSSSSNGTSNIPDKAPATAHKVNAADYQNNYGAYVFRVAGGTVWCTINNVPNFVVCEQNEVDVAYKIPDTPSTCQGAWGYQARLWAYQPSVGKIADWNCASGLYSDPTGAYDLPSGSEIVVGDITCYASDKVVRCDNLKGQYLALGSEVYGFSN
jgi:uncharacterized protein YceK